MQIAEKVKEFFHNEGIHSTTIQPEFVDFENEVSVTFSYINVIVIDYKRQHVKPNTLDPTPFTTP